MGIIRQGIFGGFEGRTGPLVGRKVKGKSIIAAFPRKNTKPRTAAQIDQRLKFDLVIGFLKWLKCLIAIGFKDPDGKKNSFNTAVKYNFKRIITGTSPNYSIDYSKLVFSRGSLAGPNSPSVSLETNTLIINWQPDVQQRFNQHTDRASFLVYCPGKIEIIIHTSSTERSALGYRIAIPQNFEGNEMYVFMSFSSVNGKVVSDSKFLGTV